MFSTESTPSNSSSEATIKTTIDAINDILQTSPDLPPKVAIDSIKSILKNRFSQEAVQMMLEEIREKKRLSEKTLMGISINLSQNKEEEKDTVMIIDPRNGDENGNENGDKNCQQKIHFVSWKEFVKHWEKKQKNQ